VNPSLIVAEIAMVNLSLRKRDLRYHDLEKTQKRPVELESSSGQPSG
jgi:hypothetical protein